MRLDRVGQRPRLGFRDDHPRLRSAVPAVVALMRAETPEANAIARIRANVAALDRELEDVAQHGVDAADRVRVALGGELSEPRLDRIRRDGRDAGAAEGGEDVPVEDARVAGPRLRGEAVEQPSLLPL